MTTGIGLVNPVTSMSQNLIGMPVRLRGPPMRRVMAQDERSACLPSKTLVWDLGESLRSRQPFRLRFLQTLLEKVEKLQASLVGYATQDGGGLEIADFMRLRQEIMNDGRVKGKIPDIIRRYRDQGQFWQFIKHKLPTYRERREYIWQEIRPPHTLQR